MSATILALAVLAAGAQLSTCPANSPPSWSMPKSHLESVRVVFYETTRQGDETSVFEMAPHEEYQRGGYLYQTWNMNFDAPKYVFAVDCQYSGTDRVIPLDVSKAAQCTGKWKLRKNKLVQTSLVFNCR
jgi:hypothetical protein